MDLGLTFRALAQGRVDLIGGNRTNGLIAALQLHRLQGIRGYSPLRSRACMPRRKPELVPLPRGWRGTPPGPLHAVAQHRGGPAAKDPRGRGPSLAGGAQRVEVTAACRSLRMLARPFDLFSCTWHFRVPMQ
jgi:hypothetical protein